MNFIVLVPKKPVQITINTCSKYYTWHKALYSILKLSKDFVKTCHNQYWMMFFGQMFSARFTRYLLTGSKFVINRVFRLLSTVQVRLSYKHKSGKILNCFTDTPCSETECQGLHLQVRQWFSSVQFLLAFSKHVYGFVICNVRM